MKKELKDWEGFMSTLIKEAEKQKGQYFRTEITKTTKINRNRLYRFFNMKNPPKLDTLFIILNFLDLELVIRKKENKC